MSKPAEKTGAEPAARPLSVLHGRVSGDWYYEENAGTTRFGIRVTEKLHEERSAFQKLVVYETAFFGRVLTLDDVVMLTERDEFVYHEMLVHVPLCSMPEPRRVLIVGGGDCGALREALKHPNLERVVQCDIDERVTRVSEKFFPWVGKTLTDPRAELVFGDGIDYVKRHATSFDLVVVDSTDPVGPAESPLASRRRCSMRSLTSAIGPLSRRRIAAYCSRLVCWSGPKASHTSDSPAASTSSFRRSSARKP